MSIVLGIVVKLTTENASASGYHFYKIANKRRDKDFLPQTCHIIIIMLLIIGKSRPYISLPYLSIHKPSSQMRCRLFLRKESQN